MRPDVQLCEPQNPGAHFILFHLFSSRHVRLRCRWWWWCSSSYSYYRSAAAAALKKNHHHLGASCSSFDWKLVKLRLQHNINTHDCLHLSHCSSTTTTTIVNHFCCNSSFAEFVKDLCVWEKRRHTHTQLIRSRELKAPLIPHTNTHTHKHKHTQLRSSKLSTIVLGGLFQTFSLFFLASSSSPYFTTPRLLTKMTKRAVFCFPDLFK